jgi:hypothetical protein
LLTIKAVCPSEVALKLFPERVVPLFRCIESNMEQFLTLAAIRDALLLRLLSEEIRVRDAKRFVGDCYMKKETSVLFNKALNSLIFLDHSFEMLLKAAILHRGGKIREKRAKQTIGFDGCVRNALSDGVVKFLTNENALSLQVINSLRDAAQHHIVHLSEQHLYLHAQSGLTIFREILKNVFNRDLIELLPERVLPISTSSPKDIASFFETEIDEIKKLLKPKSRKRVEAFAKL